MRQFATSVPQVTPSPRLGSLRAGVTFFGLVALLLANRQAAKLGLGPLYLLDVLLAINVWSIGGLALRNFTTYRYPFAIAALACAWLLIEWMANDIDINNARRAAAAFYLFVPALLTLSGRRLYAFIERHLIGLALAITALTAVGLDDISPTMSAQVLALLAATAWRVRRGQRRILSVAVILGVFLLVASGLTSDGAFYRTPVVGSLVGLVAAYGAVMLLKKGASGKAKLIIAGYSALLCCSLVIVTFSGSSMIGQFTSGVSGLFGGESAAAGSQRARGDSAGTAKTRVVFWTAIIEDALQAPSTLLFGSGHAQSFFEKTRPYKDFVDPELLEPHNSFMGLFFRYGLSGLLLLVLFLYRMAKSAHPLHSGIDHAQYAAFSFALAFVFAFFEVVLEGPQGSFIFWLIWLAPRFVGRGGANEVK